jgi:hypothetical protein
LADATRTSTCRPTASPGSRRYMPALGLDERVGEELRVDHRAGRARDLDQVAVRVAHEHLHLAVRQRADAPPRLEVDRAGAFARRNTLDEVGHLEAEVPAELVRVRSSFMWICWRSLMRKNCEWNPGPASDRGAGRHVAIEGTAVARSSTLTLTWWMWASGSWGFLSARVWRRTKSRSGSTPKPRPRGGSNAPSCSARSISAISRSSGAPPIGTSTKTPRGWRSAKRARPPGTRSPSPSSAARAPAGAPTRARDAQALAEAARDGEVRLQDVERARVEQLGEVERSEVSLSPAAIGSGLSCARTSASPTRSSDATGSSTKRRPSSAAPPQKRLRLGDVQRAVRVAPSARRRGPAPRARRARAARLECTASTAVGPSIAPKRILTARKPLPRRSAPSSSPIAPRAPSRRWRTPARRSRHGPPSRSSTLSSPRLRGEVPQREVDAGDRRGACRGARGSASRGLRAAASPRACRSACGRGARRCRARVLRRRAAAQLLLDDRDERAPWPRCRPRAWPRRSRRGRPRCVIGHEHRVERRDAAEVGDVLRRGIGSGHVQPGGVDAADLHAGFVLSGSAAAGSSTPSRTASCSTPR